KAFVVTDFTYGKPLTASRSAGAELQRRFVEVVDNLAVLHEHGIVLGNISDVTFMVTGDGRVMIQGLLGDFGAEASGTAVLPNADTMQYLAPEQRGGSAATTASDIFSLGLFAYRLFTGRHIAKEKGPLTRPDEAIAMAPAPSVIGSKVPLWVDAVLAKCLETHSESRYHNAQELRVAVHEAMASGQVPESASKWAQRTVMVRPNTVGTLRQQVSEGDSSPEHRGARDAGHARQQAPLPAIQGSDELAVMYQGEGVKPAKFAMTVFVSLILGVAAAGGIYLYNKPAPQPVYSDLAEEMKLHEQAASPELRLPMRDMVAPGVPLARKKQALKIIAESSDPVAYPVLVSTVRGAKGAELRTAAAQYIVERLRRENLLRSAEVIGKWFATVEQANLSPASSPAYTHLLNSLDRTLPLDARRFALSKAYAFEQIVSLQIAAALCLDEADPGSFLPVLREFLSDQYPMDELQHRNVGALILSNRTLALAFDEEVASDLQSFSPGDLAWVLVRLAESDSNIIFDVAAETLRRNIVPPYQAIFLKTLVDADRYNLPPAVRRSLARGARGELEERDVISIGRWTAREAEPVLLAISAIANDKDVALAAFDTLAARSLETEPARSLVSWVKRNYWDYREQLVKAVGILGNIEIASPEQIEYAFDKLMPFAAGGQLIKVMINTNDEMLLEKTLERIGEAAPVDEIIPLLTHDSKEIRIAAIHALKGHNELSVLQAIYHAYDREKDADVKEVYHKLHWVTRNRAGEEQPSGTNEAAPSGAAAPGADEMAIPRS
ncbi:MAG: hypothetical protein KDD66_11065, partial [Bdellovibrionales bacterium]|nr:hypothetical protein [Bdellovibrionales bacterium]